MFSKEDQMNRRDFLKFATSVIALSMCPRVKAEIHAENMERNNNSKMIYRNLGRSDIRVSTVALGIESFVNKPAAHIGQQFKFAAENGINFVDICLSDPQLLEKLSQAMAACDSRFVIQGHAGSVWKNGQYLRSRDMLAVREAFERLFRILQVDCIDIGMIHYVDTTDDLKRIMTGDFIKYMKQLKQEGKIRCVGMSSHNPAVALKAVQTGDIDVLMFSVNLAYDMQPGSNGIVYNERREKLYTYCAQHGIGIDVMKAYAGGDLLNARVSPFGQAFTPVQCLDYVLNRPAVASVMIGCGSISEISQAVRWCTASEQEKDYSNILSRLDKRNWLGHCIYCGHCAPCPVEIDIASVNKYLNLALAGKDGVPETVREHYLLLQNHASDCVGCGACEKRCPFEVAIIEKMQQAVEIFGK